jgi:hypothetical protein
MRQLRETNKRRRKTCSFCRDRALHYANDAKGKTLAFCRQCALIIITKAIDMLGDKIREIL